MNRQTRSTHPQAPAVSLPSPDPVAAPAQEDPSENLSFASDPLSQERSSEHSGPTLTKSQQKAVAPKRPSSAYIIYQREKRAEILARAPSMKITDQIKEIASCWSRTSRSERLKFIV